MKICSKHTISIFPLLRSSILLIALCFILFNCAQAQLSIKVGYNSAFGSLKPINTLFEMYNTQNAQTLENSFGNLNFLHGIGVGVAHRFGIFAIELDWENINRSRSSLLYNSTNDSFQSDLYKFSFNSLSLSMDTYTSRFGFGVGLYNQKLRIRREIGNDELKLVTQNEYALDLHMNISFSTGSIISVVLKPYYRFSLGSYNLQPFANDLLSTSSVETLPMKIGFYGIRLVFYNGN